MLAWASSNEDERVEDLIGIVRGRTVNSSRGRQKSEPAPAKKTAGEKSRRAQRGAGKGDSHGKSSRGGATGKGRRRR